MGVSLSMIALNRGSKLFWKAFEEDLASSWPTLPSPTDVKKEENTLSFDLGHQSIAMGMMPGPIPEDSWAAPQRQTWIWPDAVEKLQDHRTHLIVTAVGDAAPLEQAQLLTMVTASLVSACGQPAGVMWGDAGLMVSPDVFREIALEALPGELPLCIWVAVFLGKNEDGTTVGFTRGLQSLDLMDFVTEDATDEPADLCERFYGLADYLLENGPVIEDGHTIGDNAQEKIRISFESSPFGHECPIMRLKYSPQTGHSSFGLRH
ncbi:DUF4261 domain-containing protein [Bremerella sp. JC770]|uniref:DUF4261 domain-containing protein n=1 Tax=Bremerella sp. JC770 TaxID=3232137 RepID=UPI003458EF6F